MAASTSKLYDLTVFGVTGFTGKFVAEEIHRIQTTLRKDLKWAVAGRNAAKLTSTLQELGITGVDVMVADVSNEASIRAMCSKTRVVVDVVGPYIKYGEVVVKSCISEHSDYVDITGEEYFVEQMITKYSEAAAKAGVYIVNYCGYDSVPSDIGAAILRKHLGSLEYVECILSSKTEVVNSGTWESALRAMRTAGELRKYRKSMGASRLLEPQPKNTSIPKRRSMFYSPVAGTWCVPFPGPDLSCIRRTAFYHQELHNTPPVAAKLYLGVGSFLELLVTSLLFMTVILPLNFTNWGFNMLCKYPRLFTGGAFSHAGPTKAQIARASSTVYVEGATPTGPGQRRARVTMQGGEPAYVSTSVFMVHSAMCLLEERDKLPECGGIYTPGIAFGDTTIVERMEESGKVKFTVKDL